MSAPRLPAKTSTNRLNRLSVTAIILEPPKGVSRQIDDLRSH